MAATCWFALVDTLTQSFIAQFLPNFIIHILVAFVKLSSKFEYGFCLINDKQDGHQNGCLWSVCICGGSNLVIYHQISSKFQA